MKGATFLRIAVFASGLILAALSCPPPAGAAPSEADSPKPPPLETLQTIPKVNMNDGKSALPLDIRRDAMREAALSYGARGGLAWRTYEIRQELDMQANYLDKVFNFRYLLIAAPSGMMIEPPVVSEQVNAMIINAGGQEAAVSDRIYDINADAKIVSTARSWRLYLERDWGDVTPPPDVLRPTNEEERERWKKWVEEGWERGIEQANDIFNADINDLLSDYQGMIRYRALLRQNMISPPYAMLVDRGVTGNGKQMRIGDRAVQITGKSQLVTGVDEWLPANR